MQGWLVTLILVITSGCGVDSRIGNTTAGRFSPLAVMRSCIQEIRGLGARIDSAILWELSGLVLERRFKHMDAKRSEMWSNSFKYSFELLPHLLDEVAQKKQELLSQAEEKFANYEKAHTGSTQEDNNLFLAELAKQRDEYLDRMKSLCACYRDKFDDLKDEYDLRILGIANTYHKKMVAGAQGKLEEMLSKSAENSDRSQAVFDNFLMIKKEIDAKLEKAMYDHRKSISEDLLRYAEKLEDNFAHYEQLLFEALLRYQYRYGGREAREEYQRRQEQQQREQRRQEHQRQEQRQREERRQEQRRQEYRQQAKNLTVEQRKEYAALLGVEVDASLSEIKKAFRKLAKQYHPDKKFVSQETNKEKFAEVADAYFKLREFLE